MADRLTIYRGALALLGQERLSSLTEAHPARYALDDAWQSTGDYLLEQGLWNFAMRSVELAYDEDVSPLFGYDYAFSKPSDWVRTAELSELATFVPPLADYMDEPSYWYANPTKLYLRYVSNDDAYGWNVGSWRQAFAKTFEAYLAFESGLPISNDRGNRNDLFGLYEKRLSKARVLDAVDEKVRYKPEGRLVRARRTRVVSRMDG